MDISMKYWRKVKFKFARAKDITNDRKHWPSMDKGLGSITQGEAGVNEQRVTSKMCT